MPTCTSFAASEIVTELHMLVLMLIERGLAPNVIAARLEISRAAVEEFLAELETDGLLESFDVH